MQLPHMLIDCSRRLRAPIAFRVIEVKRVYAEFADGAFKRDAAVQRLGGVVAHSFIVVFFAGITADKRCWPSRLPWLLSFRGSQIKILDSLCRY